MATVLTNPQDATAAQEQTSKAMVRFAGEPMKDSQFGYVALADNLSLSLSVIQKSSMTGE